MLMTTLLALCTPQFAEPMIPRTEPAPVFRLWDAAVPGAHGDGPDDVPTLTPFLPQSEARSGAAVVVFPGGGYGGLAGHEGHGYAQWLCAQGIAAFVVRYRLGSHGYHHPVMLGDAARAVRTVRARAAEWALDPRRIGVMGSSAGGHLASTILTHFDGGQADADDPIERVSSRPDFGILCYPVISMLDPLAHRGSRKNLLGDAPAPELLDLLSSERQVTRETPPTFLWHTADDGVVAVGNSYAFADALGRAGVSHELHVYPSGRHGLGLGLGDPAGHRAADLLPWTRACSRWLLGVADTRQVAEGVPAAVLEVADRLAGAWAEQLVAQNLWPNRGPATTAVGTVVARIGTAVVIHVDSGAADAPRPLSLVRFRAGDADHGLAGVAAVVGDHQVVRLLDRGAATPVVGDTVYRTD